MNDNNIVWSHQTLPVCLIKSCRVEFLQQEIDYYVEGILVWFVKHIPASHNTTINLTIAGIKLNAKSNVTVNDDFKCNLK